jgi:thioredoxin
VADRLTHTGNSTIREGGNNLGCRPQVTNGTRRRTMTAIGRLTQKKFEQSILHGVTLVDFDAPWCKPCRDQKPIIDALKKNYQGTAAVKKINIDDNRDIAFNLGIQSIPTIIIYKNGREMNRFIGLQTRETLKNALRHVINQAKW